MNSYLDTNSNIFLSTIDINQDSIEISKVDEVDDLKKKIINAKKMVIKEIAKLNKFEYIEIFKILRSHNVIYSENVNGIFINLSPVNINVLNDIILFINYVKNKNIELLEKENTQQKTKETVFGNNDETIDNLESKIQMLKDNLKNSLETLDKK